LSSSLSSSQEAQSPPPSPPKLLAPRGVQPAATEQLGLVESAPARAAAAPEEKVVAVAVTFQAAASAREFGADSQEDLATAAASALGVSRSLVAITDIAPEDSVGGGGVTVVLSIQPPSGTPSRSAEAASGGPHLPRGARPALLAAKARDPGGLAASLQRAGLGPCAVSGVTLAGCDPQPVALGDLPAERGAASAPASPGALVSGAGAAVDSAEATKAAAAASLMGEARKAAALGDWPTAALNFERATELAPKTAGAWLGLGRCLGAQRRDARAARSQQGRKGAFDGGSESGGGESGESESEAPQPGIAARMGGEAEAAPSMREIECLRRVLELDADLAAKALGVLEGLIAAPIEHP